MLQWICLAIIPSPAFCRYPTVAAGQVAFVHADQIWIAPKSGGEAEKLTSTPGSKSCLHFSADGKVLAFTSDGDGNESIYTLRLSDHVLTRVTHQPMGSELCGWSPDQKLLFMSSVFVPNYQGDWRQLFTVPATGGLPQQLPLTEAADGAVSPDNKSVAFTEYASRRLSWKGNMGGLASDLWLFDQTTGQTKKITDWKGTDTFPLWHGTTLYYLSDAGQERRLNLWRIDPAGGQRHQVTHFADFDIDDPSIGADDIVFQKAGALFDYDIPHDKCSPISVSVADPPNQVEIDAGASVVSALPTDAGDIVVEADGDIWTTDSAGKNAHNLTNTDSIAERQPVVSPDGKEIAYTSDAAGEYNLETIPLGGGPATRITHRTKGFLSKPSWSPDSQKIAFSDNTGQLYIFFRASGELIQADRDPWNRGLHLSWSPDSKWLAYTKTEPTMMQSLWLYNTDQRHAIRLTAGMTKDEWPVFDRKGDYLFFTSGRDPRGRVFDSIDFDNFVYPANGALMAMPLRRDLAMPWAPKLGNSDKRIDLEDIERRATLMTQTPINASDLDITASSDLIYIDRSGAEPAIKCTDFENVRKTLKLERILLEGADSYSLSPNGTKLLAHKGGGYVLLDLGGKSGEPASVEFKGLTKTVDDKASWGQIFADAWRFCRDYYYDRTLGGVDWNAIRQKYEPLAGACSTRSELDYVLGQMAGELHSSHFSVEPSPGLNHPNEKTGMLGVDFELDQGAYRFKRIYDAPAWDSIARSVLRRPGLDVREGDYLLAVNGKPVDTTQDPWAAFAGTAQTPTRLTISRKPTLDADAKVITVVPGPDDNYVRGRSWIEDRRAYVANKSGGRVGYVYIPDTFNYGADAFVRQFYNEFQKEALIIDDRWNGGGRTPERFIEILRRQRSSYGVRQNTLTSDTPAFAHSGPMCMVINGASKSGGDSLPLLFKQANLGKLVGTPTMGARGGTGGPEPPAFVDGGRILVAHIGSVDAAGHWSLPEGGVQPDLFVQSDPANGDKQLDAAIALMMRELKTKPRY
jgi:tricorn protease